MSERPVCYECGLPIDGEVITDACGKVYHSVSGFPRPCIAALSARVAELEEYFREDARCPCCDETERCHEECTLAEDCHDVHERVRRARAALDGKHD